MNPTDAQVHDGMWTIITYLGYVGYFGLMLAGWIIGAILWQVNCLLRERVLEMRDKREYRTKNTIKTTPAA